jgi:hypothetical protein
VGNKDNGRRCYVQKLAVQVSIVAFGGGLIQESIATFLLGERNNDGNSARAAVASSLGTIF